MPGFIKMPVNPTRYVAKSKTTKTTIASSSTSSTMLLSMLMPLAIVLAITTIMPLTNAEYTSVAASSSSGQDDLVEFLRTESVLIDTLRNYIDTLEEKIFVIKSKTLEIKGIHNQALNDTDKFLNNPINALTILKRFTSDWNALQQYAGNVEGSDEIVKNIADIKGSLTFPSEEDFDEAAGNLLRIQDIYKLEPQGLSLGEVHGVKLGSEMSWSDCLEIGRKSDKNGDYMIAKFWMETALGKLPAAANVSNEAQNNTSEKARFEILEALLNAEFNMGNSQVALNIANEMLQLKPTHKGVLKAKETIEHVMEKREDVMKKYNKLQEKVKKQKKKSKSTEELLIEEICRDSGSSSTDTYLSSTKYCSMERGNLPQLLLQPLKVEFLSLDPYIVMYHNALSAKQIDSLRNLLEETNDDDDDNVDDALGGLKFTNMAKMKLTRINQQLQQITGHSSELFDEWQAERRGFEDAIEFDMSAAKKHKKQKIVANVLFNMQSAKLGGAVVFPQLELSVDVPTASLLYWSNLNEFGEDDYRTKQYVCPVIAATQIAAVSSIRQA